MGQVMKLANGSIETILNERDFEDILDKYLGSEAADYWHEHFKNYDEAMSKAEDYEDKCLRVEELEREKAELEDTITNLENKLEELQHENG